MIEQYANAEFLRPELLWLLLGVGALLAIGLFRRRRHPAILLLRTLVWLALILALADPVIQEERESRKYTALIDTSRSVSPEGQRALLEQLQPFIENSDTAVSLIPFAQRPGKRALELKGDVDLDEIEEDLAQVAKEVSPEETNISSAIQRSLSEIDSSSILLLSDGFETAGDAIKIARRAATNGVAIYPLVPNDSFFKTASLSISSLHTPITSAAGDKVKVRTSVKNTFDEVQTGRLQIWIDSEQLYDQEVSVNARQELLVTSETPILKGGLHRVRALLTPNVGGKKAQERHRWVSVKEKSKILILHGSVEDRRVINELIRLKGYGVEDIIADGTKNIPTTFSGYSSIVMNNVAKHQLPGGFLKSIEGFVKKGGGVLLIGGDRSYGLGKYINTPLEKISPLKFVPPQTKKRRLRVAVVLVIDKSGSMVQQNKIVAAKEAAIMSIESLKDDDFVSVIGFDAAPFVIIDLKPVREVKPIAQRRLRSLTAAGQTDLLPALAEARQRLRRVKAGRKHVIVLSDGRFPLSTDVYASEINQMKRDGVTISAVALGSEADVPFMQYLSTQGKGAFYHTLDPSRLPKIFVQDIKVATGERTINENQLFAVGMGPGGLSSTSVRRYPPLKGFVETLPKKGSTLELITKKGKKVFPILASWKYGKGSVVAFTSDANGRWSFPWLRWPDFPKFWGDVFEQIKNRSDSEAGEIDFDLRYSLNRKNISLELSVFDPKLRKNAAPTITAKIIEPGGELKQTSFRAVKKGRFKSEIDNARPGDYQLSIQYGKLTFPPVALTLSGEAFGEAPGKGIHLRNLEEIAYVTGGAINPAIDQVAAKVKSSKKATPLFRPLLFLAFGLILLEALLRELGISWFTGFRKRSRITETSSRSALGRYHHSQ